MEKSLVLIKPDAVERNLIGEIICFYERENLKITDLKMIKASRNIAEKHYEEHKDKPYYEELISFITRSPLCAMVLEGKDAISKVRRTNGNTDPTKADKTTIRGNFGISKTENSVHSSDSPENALQEISLWF